MFILGGEIMEYTINKLSQIAHISTRTLRYYHEIGLLMPARVNSSGYRIYGEKEVDTLQQILFFKELGLDLETIKQIVMAPDFDRQTALSQHLDALLKRREHIDRLIRNVTQTMGAMKGEITMTDVEKFEAFKKELIDDNEKKYGKEVREKYGDAVMEGANAKLKQMNKSQYDNLEALSHEVNMAIKAAFETGDPKGELAKKACELHKQWICCYWPEGTYTKEAHIGLAKGYVDDPRFTAYYDKIAVGAAQFLYEAISHYYAGK